MDNKTIKLIEDLLSKNKIVLFMKGTKDFPRCGYSHEVLCILKEYNINFTDIDILENMDLRTGLKIYSDWPTFPQLYVNGKLIGGRDIILQKHNEGSLKEALRIDNTTSTH